jgi:hypothetical protein
MYASDPAYVVFGTYDGHCVVLDTRDPGFPVDIDSGRSECFLLVGDFLLSWISRGSLVLWAERGGVREGET